MPTKTRILYNFLMMTPTVFLASAALGGGLTVIEPTPSPIAPSQSINTDWGGLYVGGQFGLASIDSDALREGSDGIGAGAHAGYLFDLGRIVLGAEIDFNLTDIESVDDDFALSSAGSVKLRAGYDAGDFMPYIAAGSSQAKLSGAIEDTDTGTFAGVGVDFQINNGMRIGAEVVQYQFENFAETGNDFDATAAGARLSFRF